MIRTVVILAAASCVLAAGAYAATYKWVDDQGVTHYGEKPPPGQKSQEVKIRTGPPASPAAPAETPAAKGKEAPAAKGKDGPPATRLQEQEREFQQRRVDRMDKEREEEKEQARLRAEAERTKRACITARNNLEAFNKDLPVYHLDEKGERKFVDDKTRAAEIVKAKKEIATYCKS